MSSGFLHQVRKAIATLNPSEIRHSADRPVRLLLQGSSLEAETAFARYLLSGHSSHERRAAARQALDRASDPKIDGRFHLVLYERGTPIPDGWQRQVDAFPFDLTNPKPAIDTILEKRDEYSLALARLFTPFREAEAAKTIHRVSAENALFSLMTALPNVLPTVASLPWAVGEYASDTAVLTANQIRMAFLLAAASDREVGYKEQRSEIGSIIAGAWGWRTVARQLTGKIPFGGGLIPKAAIAYAGTYVVGLSLERIYRMGYGMTRDERDEAYQGALARGREVAGTLVERVRGRKEQESE